MGYNMKIDYEFLVKTVNARKDVGEWLRNRPYTGLDVTDVQLLADGFDYLAYLIKDLTGTDPTEFVVQQVDKDGREATIQLNFGD